MPLPDYQALTDDLVRDDSGKITAADRDEAIARAVARYSGDRPRVKVEDLVAADANLLPLPAGWVSEFSALRSIESPVGEVPPRLLDQDRYGLYQEAGQSAPNKIMLLDGVALGATLRVAYSARHALDPSTDTIRPDDREAVCAWAAALLLDQLAALFSGDSYSAIQADSVDHGSKAGEYARRAAALRRHYHNLLGIDEKKSVPAGVFVNLDQYDSRGQDRITHPRRYR